MIGGVIISEAELRNTAAEKIRRRLAKVDEMKEVCIDRGAGRECRLPLPALCGVKSSKRASARTVGDKRKCRWRPVEAGILHSRKNWRQWQVS